MMYFGSPAYPRNQDSMAKKKRGLAGYKRAKKNSNIIKAKENPPPLQDVMEFVVPGFAGYAGTRMASRIVHSIALKRFPKLAKHASVLSTGVAAAGAWFLAHRIEKTRPYHTPIVVGASIAAIQTAVQAYLPKYGWIVSDHNMKAAPALTTQASSAVLPAPAPVRVASVGAPSPSDAKVLLSPGSAASTTSAAPKPIASLSPEEVASELDELDMGSLSSGFDLDGNGGYGDFDLEELEDSVTIN